MASLAPMFSDFRQWRQLTVNYACRCELCNDLIEPRKTAMYNRTTKKMRCHTCHASLPTPTEVWTADVQVMIEHDDRDDEVVTQRLRIMISTKRRETDPPEGVRLLELLEVIPAEVYTSLTRDERRAKFDKGHYC